MEGFEENRPQFFFYSSALRLKFQVYHQHSKDNDVKLTKVMGLLKKNFASGRMWDNFTQNKEYKFTKIKFLCPACCIYSQIHLFIYTSSNHFFLRLLEMKLQIMQYYWLTLIVLTGKHVWRNLAKLKKIFQFCSLEYPGDKNKSTTHARLQFWWTVSLALSGHNPQPL